MIVLDANALIALLDNTDAHHSWAFQMFKNTLDIEFAISAFTLAETMVRPVGLGKLEAFNLGIAGLGLNVIGFDPEDASALAQLRAVTGLRMPDAVVLFTAKKLNCWLATSDARVAASARQNSVFVLEPAGE